MIGTLSAFVLAGLTLWFCWAWWRHEKQRQIMARDLEAFRAMPRADDDDDWLQGQR